MGVAFCPLPSFFPEEEAQISGKEEEADTTTTCERDRESGSNDIPYKTLEWLGYTFTEEISKVNHGVIQLARHQASGTLRCVKCYFKPEIQSDSFEFLKSEAELMFILGEHPQIGEAIEIFQDAHSYFLSMPYYSGGNLLGLKTKAEEAGVVLVEDWWKNILCQCLNGLAYMHAQDVMHCDIKEPNIMLRTGDLQEPDVVIIDLGVAQPATTKRTIIYGTPGYIPPEVWEGKYWYPQSDMFSLGVVVVQAVIGKTGIFTENTRTYKEVFEATRSRPPPFDLMPVEFPALQGVAQQMLLKDFQGRPSASSMLEHPWEATPQERTLAKLSDGRHRFSLKPFRRHSTLPAIMVSLPPDDVTMEPPVEAVIPTSEEQAPAVALPPPMVAEDVPPSGFQATLATGENEVSPPVLRTPAVLQRPQKRTNFRPQLKKQLSFAA